MKINFIKSKNYNSELNSIYFIKEDFKVGFLKEFLNDKEYKHIDNSLKKKN